MYSLEEVSQLTQLSKSSIRYYDQHRIMTIKRNEKGYRVFTEEDLVVLKYIRFMKKSKFSLKEIAIIVKALIADDYEDAIVEINQQLQLKLTDLKEQLTSLQKNIVLIETIQPAITHVRTPEDEQEILKKISQLMAD